MPNRVNRNNKPYSRPAKPRRSDGDWLHDRAPGATVTRSSPPAAVPEASNAKLVVSNLHYEVTPKDLTQVFGVVGTLVREPLIRYDRSGRSTGVAIITYETPAEAKKALAQYNGKLCKGQPMSIEFDAGPPPRQRRASAPSLLNRIQKPALIDRLSQNDTKVEPKPHTAKPQSARAAANGTGPIRTKRGAHKPAPKKAKATPKSVEELDMELDAFMKDDATPTPAPTQPAAAAQSEDVEMS